MKRNRLTVIVVWMAALLAVGALPTLAQQPGESLVQIVWHSADDLDRVEASGVQVYARLTVAGEPSLLAGAAPRQVQALRDDGLSVTVLDPELAGASYYLAYPPPNRPAPEWAAFGHVLLDDGAQVLLRASPDQAERLPEAGVQIVAVTLTPKPLRPAAAEGAFPSEVEWDPIVQAMIDQVQPEVVSEYDRQLAGELPVWVDGGWYTITSRYTYSGMPIQKATSWVGQKMAGLGLDVEYHTWGGETYPNVIGQQDGLINPDDIFIIGGHVDDVQGTPGADDNASGSVATMLAADIMSQYQWGCTLRFALWTGEEQGLLGSEAYAQRAYQNGENIVGYLNLDMIAWNTLGSEPGIDLIYNSSMPPTLQLAQLMADVVSTYDLDLVPELRTGLGGGSDHSSFWNYGYTAILGIEDQSDFNPYYHGPGDTPAHTDLGFFTNFVKAAVATYAHMSGCLIPSGIGFLDGHVTSSRDGSPVEGALLTITDPLGRSVSTRTDASGYYTRTLVADTYDVTASAYGFLPAQVEGVVVVTDTITTQDFALRPAPVYAVKGLVTDAASGAPLEATIAFEGSPVTVVTDPATGHYRAVLAAGNYVMHVTAPEHRPQERPIVVDQGQIQDFQLEPLPCILLVDDDNDAPDTRLYFSAALDAIGYDYDVFAVSGAGDGPSLDGLQGYRVVIWFSGDKYGGAGPNSSDEAALAAYLDGGGRLFLSAQDYLYDFGLTSFGQSYLGIGSYSNDNGDAVGIVGLAGDPIGDGLGPYPLAYPGGFSDWGDVVYPGFGGSAAFKATNNSNKLDTDKDGGAWRTVFFGTDWVPVYFANNANGRQVLQRILDWFGGCEEPATTHVGNIKIRFADKGGGLYSVMAGAPILDQNGAPVPEALVSARWTLPDGSTRDKTAISLTTGMAKFRVNSTLHGLYELCVTDVAKEGYTYDPSQNLETCDTVIVP